MAGSTDRWDKGYSTGKADGIAEGREQVIQEVIKYLQDRYLDESVERDSPGGRAVLRIAREVVSVARGARP